MQVILYYDWTLTFGEEYWRIWKSPRTMSSFLFFLNRYLPVLGVRSLSFDMVCYAEPCMQDIAVNVGNFYIFPTERVRTLNHPTCSSLTCLRRGEPYWAHSGRRI